MLNRKFFVTIVGLGLIPLSAMAGVKVAGVDLNITGNRGQINIATQGRSSELPDVNVSGKTIEITLNKADSFITISKKVQGVLLSATQENGRARILAHLPYNVSPDAVNVGWKNNQIEVNFPRGKAEKVAAAEHTVSPKEVVAPPAEIVNPKKVSKESLNEDYLNGLMKENAPEVKVAKKIAKDEIAVKQASIAKVAEPQTKQNTDTFSFAGYAAKFTVFLAMVLGLFYGIVQLLKKGVFTRGKLGFLNNTQMIEVLSTTYVAPKRSLMVVRAHKQIFLVASSESGITYLSEMTDTTGLIKAGEKHITGSNFDTNLSEAQTNELFDAYKLKENIMESAPMPSDLGLTKLVAAKDDIVKFSEELKKKAKKLRPIENRAN